MKILRLQAGWLIGILALPAAMMSADGVARTLRIGTDTYVNHGLVGVGRLPAAMRDAEGETFGSFSAFAFAPGSWMRRSDGTYTGALWSLPDRGYNNPETTNWRARLYRLQVEFRPAAGAGPFGQDQVRLLLAQTLLLREADGTPLTALDAVPSGAGTRAGFPPLPVAHNGRISLDGEGLAITTDGSFLISDEYGPYLYRFSTDGVLRAAVRPPEAFVPRRRGADSFASNNPAAGQPAPQPADPESGRQNNQGLEGLTLTPDGRAAWALMQSALRQDGGAGGRSATRRHARLLAYDLTGGPPVLTGEYVVPLPLYEENGRTLVAAQSEIHALSDRRFLMLARDNGNGRGAEHTTSRYRRILIGDLSDATNIAGAASDQPAGAVAPGGVLAAGVRSVQCHEFIDLNDPVELARFGLHNGPADDVNNLAEKWEALALVPAHDPAAPDDWFLFVGNDNDFITQRGYQAGESYAHPSGIENDTMVLVYRLTLPPRAR